MKNMKLWSLVGMRLCLCVLVLNAVEQNDYLDEFYMPHVRNLADAEYVIGSSAHTIAYVYNLPQQEIENKTAHYKEVNRVYAMVQNYEQADDERYVDADIKFIGINRAEDNLNELAHKYNLAASEDYLLFFKGEKLALKKTVPNGFTKAQMKAFFNSIKLKDLLPKVAAAQRAAKQGTTRRVVRRRCCGPAPAPYVGLGYYDPYWYGPGWRPYYWGPSYWGYTYPYRGYYYAGPQYGIAFSV